MDKRSYSSDPGRVKVLHLLTSGGIGGIETLCREIGKYARFDNEFCFMFGEGPIYEQMKKLGMNVVSFAHYPKISRKRMRKLVNLVSDRNVVIVHHDDPFLQFYFLLLRKIHPKTKYIAMIHHCYNPAIDFKGYGAIKCHIRNLLIERIFTKSDELIFVSNAGYSSYLGNFKISNDKVHIIYNGISSNLIKEGGGISKKFTGNIQILYVGRLVELKNVNILLIAFSKIVDKSNIRLVIVGDGPERNKLEILSQDLGIASIVSFEGYQLDVVPYLRAGDIFVYPSSTEIFGISILEAMAFKCICIGNNVGGIPEIIHDKENGLLNYSLSEDELANKIEEAISICQDNKKRMLMEEKAFNTSKSFSIDSTIYNLEAVIESCVCSADKGY